MPLESDQSTLHFQCLALGRLGLVGLGLRFIAPTLCSSGSQGSLAISVRDSVGSHLVGQHFTLNLGGSVFAVTPLAWAWSFGLFWLSLQDKHSGRQFFVVVHKKDLFSPLSALSWALRSASVAPSSRRNGLLSVIFASLEGRA